MEKVNRKLINYVEEKILPIYDKNDSAHGIWHIKYVIRRSIKFANQFENINLDMVYAIASFHDLALHIDRDNHEVLSAKLFYENDKMKEFFTDEQRKIIKEAIEDHRASLEYVPRSDYGKIVSSADRNAILSLSLKRTYAYTKDHYPELNLHQIITRAYEYISEKYGNCGYAKVYCIDEEFDKFKEDIKELLKDKYIFGVRYMEVNGIMDIKEKAKLFAIRAHMGQVRKRKSDNPMIIHPIAVGELLETLGYDDHVVAAGYLHDVVEDTKYTIEDIEKEFGCDIASLVMGLYELEKSLSWEERKKHNIKLPYRTKLVICADKIKNLEDLFLTFKKGGERDFSAFEKEEEQQKLYYTSIYEILVLGEDKDLPIFTRFKDILDKVFYKKRCKWCNIDNPVYVEYHDKEWGKLNFEDSYLFEMLILESFQAGLSWECVLNKREAFRQAYDGFDLDKICSYDDHKINELLLNKNIIRNVLKIKASINNAKIFKNIQNEFGTFYHYLKTFNNDKIIYEINVTHSKLSDDLSKDLKKRGMKFVGTTIIYSYLQAIGMIVSHEPECYLYQVEK